MTKDVREVRLAGTDLSVWFAYSHDGLATGPYPRKAQAERRLSSSLTIEELAVSTAAPSGGGFPEQAAFVVKSTTGREASIWRLTMSSAKESYFVLCSGRPLPFTAASVETVEAHLAEFLRRARRWLD